jgi:serine/threonine protein kinase/Flp pilus assembly protein TadD
MSERSVGAAPSLESLVARVADEFRERQARGERPDPEEYAASHPEAAPLLRKVLAALDVLGQSLASAAAVAAAAADAPVEGTLGDFRVIREVGRGGMGIVYEAEQISLRRRVALKVLPFAATMDPRQLQRFHNEARAAAGLHHTNIVPVYGVGCERGVHYYAMQFIEGRTLSELIGQRRAPASGGCQPAVSSSIQGVDTVDTPRSPEPATMPPAAQTSVAPRDAAYFRQVAQWGIEAAEALDCAHALGVVHRDVKPANLLVDAAGRLWVTDFGLAQVQSDPRLTMTGDLVGTLRYMSPEQALAKRMVIDHRTDVYSLGATLYELLTLQPVFGGADRQELLWQIALEEPKPPRQVNRAIPADLETVVLKAMEKNAAERYATAQEMGDDLERSLRDEPILAKRPGLLARGRKWARRHKVLVRAALAVMLAVLSLGAAVLWREQQQRATVQGAVESDLERAALFQQQERWGEAQAVLASAAAQLDGRGLAVLDQRVAGSRRDVDMFLRLEDARLQMAAGSTETGLDFAGADRRYAEAFAWYGLPVATLAPQEAAQRVRASTIGSCLTVALDEWTLIRGKLEEASGSGLRAVADLADDDPWRRRLRDAAVRRDRTALEGLTAEPETLSQPSISLRLLAGALQDAGSGAAAERLLRAAQQAHPADFWINFRLAIRLGSETPAAAAEAIRFYQAALALRPTSPAVYNNLGVALKAQGTLEEAVTSYRQAIALQPGFAAAHYNLGLSLWNLGDVDGAIKEYRRADLKTPAAHYNLGLGLRKLGDVDGAIKEYQAALDLKKDYPEAHVNLGVALKAKGDVDGAIKEYRAALDLKKDYPEAHYNLGLSLRKLGDLDGAIKEYRAALALKKDFREAHHNLAEALSTKGDLNARKGDLGGAIEAYQEALRFNKDDPQVYYHLGHAWRLQGKRAEAFTAWQKAVELKPDFAAVHWDLGQNLLNQGRFAESLAALKRAQELGSRQPGWPASRAEGVRRAKLLVELDAKLPKVLNGEIDPADVGERLALARVCQMPSRSLYVAAVRFFTDAFAAQPQLTDDLQSQHRYNAACAAALAGCGQGKDADQSDDKERRRLRHQALEWLRDDLAAYRRLLEKQRDKTRAQVRERMQNWQQDTDFFGLRSAEALAKLPEAERQEWQKLWADVAKTLSRAEGKAAPEQ